MREFLYLACRILDTYGKDAEAAKKASFWFEFQEGPTDLFLSTMQVIDIPALTVSNNTATDRVANAKKFRQLRKTFPGNVVILHWKRHVLPLPATRKEESKRYMAECDSKPGTSFWDATYRLCLTSLGRDVVSYYTWAKKDAEVCTEAEHFFRKALIWSNRLRNSLCERVLYMNTSIL